MGYKRRNPSIALLALAFLIVLARVAETARPLADTQALAAPLDTATIIERIQTAALAARSVSKEHDEDLNLRPLIGVLSQGGEPAPEGHSYIAASYIKFIEAAGARAVPILHDMSPAEVTRRFNAVNGILIPGGSQPLHPGNPYFDTASLLFDLTLEANDAGDYFPLHGTCLGFEALAIFAAQNESVVTDFDAEDYSQPLFPTEKAPNSRFFSALPPHVTTNLQTKPYAMQNHAHGVSYEAFAANTKLDDFFNVLTLSVDRNDAVYVSTMEAKQYPISATQWHPEKNAFEWTLEKHIPHHPDAVEVTQEVANYLIGASRRNHHAPQSRDEEEDLLIYNWNKGLEYSGTRKFVGEEVDFDEIYVFPDAEKYLEVVEKRRVTREANAEAVMTKIT